MAWLFRKKQNRVGKAVEVFEVATSTPQLFRSLGKDLDEEALLKASATRSEDTGGWATKEGRIHDNLLTRTTKGVVELLNEPGHVDGYLKLALASFAVHAGLLLLWTIVNSSNGIPTDWNSLVIVYNEAVDAALLNDSTTRFAVMFAAGHLITAVVALNACLQGEVWIFTPLYIPLMAVCVVAGGPACALAVSAHCEEQSRLKLSVMVHSKDDFVSERKADERRASRATAMQWVYLVLLAAVVSCSASGFGAASLYSNDAVHATPTLLYVLWPLNLLAPGTSEAMSSVVIMLLADWVGVLGLGVLFATTHAAQEGPTFLAVAVENDLTARLAVIFLGAFPSPYIGLALYLLLDARSKATDPMLPPCTGGLRGPQKPRAMNAWETRQRAIDWGLA
jgi:hypothetical protein